MLCVNGCLEKGGRTGADGSMLVLDLAVKYCPMLWPIFCGGRVIMGGGSGVGPTDAELLFSLCLFLLCSCRCLRVGNSLPQSVHGTSSLSALFLQTPCKIRMDKFGQFHCWLTPCKANIRGGYWGHYEVILVFANSLGGELWLPLHISLSVNRDRANEI